jgi:energy-coupling factor transport system ATP-binding protein
MKRGCTSTGWSTGRQKVLDAQNLTFAYPGKGEVLRGLSLSVGRGERVGLWGRNGSGKTTLARLLCGLLEPTSGKVTVDSLDTTDPEAIYEIRRRVGIVFQDPDDQIVETTVEREVAFGPRNLGLEIDEVDVRTDEALAIFGIRHLRRRSCNLLSAGEKQTVTVASVFAMRPDYVILDESTSLLDSHSRRRLIDAIERLLGETGAGLLFISMRLEDIWTCDRVVMLEDGAVGFEGSKVDFLAHLAGRDLPLFGTPLFVSTLLKTMPELEDEMTGWRDLGPAGMTESLIRLADGTSG